MLRRFRPDSILAWLLLILLTAILASQAVTLLLHNLNRNEALLRLEDQRAAERIAAIATFLDHTAPILRQGVADGMSGPSLEVRIATAPLVTVPETPRELAPLASALAERLGRIGWREIRAGARPMETQDDDADVVPVRVAILLRDMTWLNFEFPMVADLPWASPGLVALAALSLVAVLALCLYAMLRLTRPLDRLTRAAELLGRAPLAAGSNEAPLPEQGVGEVRRAAKAFNAMQARILRLIEDRLQMIAAISHDLKTPITRLRLRAEFMADDEMRGKMLKDLDEMEAMLGATLAFARAEGNPEPVTRFDLRDVVAEAGEHQAHFRLTIVGDAPAGDNSPGNNSAGDVSWEMVGQRLAVKRAIGNLVDNAILYGNAADVALKRSSEGFELTIDDRGPGIPEEEMALVFRPFYRLEPSRNRASGGTGLGLAIARAAILAQGGEIYPHNRIDTSGAIAGLRITVRLPAALSD